MTITEPPILITKVSQPKDVNESRNESLNQKEAPETKTTELKPEAKWFIIDNKKYDISKWENYHPGGKEILQKYYGLDATQVFYAFHGEHAFKKLNNLPVIEQTSLDQDPILREFRVLKAKIEDAGLMKASPVYYTYKTVTTLLFLIASIILLFVDSSYWLLSAISMGMFFQQAGWLSHEYCHHQIFSNRKFNDSMGYFMGNLLQGFSVTWWKERHNCHHASTNILEADPDIDNLPLFIWTKQDFERFQGWDLLGPNTTKILKHTLPYQAYYFLPFCNLLRLIWCLQSARFVADMKDHENKVYQSRSTLEKSLLIGHWSWYMAVLLFLVPWTFTAKISFFFITQFIGGFGIAIIVFFNHYACEHFGINAQTDENLNFVELQLRTTRNGNPSVLLDWFAGGLNYQIEHHLFPTLPRHNLTKVSYMIKEFCKEQNIPYQCEDFFYGVYLIHKQLHETGLLLKE
jgi:fatty acid desaturase